MDRFEEAAKPIAREAHCRYCDRLSPDEHPSTKCKGDLEDAVEDIAAFGRAQWNAAIEEVASLVLGAERREEIRALKVKE